MADEITSAPIEAPSPVSATASPRQENAATAVAQAAIAAAANPPPSPPLPTVQRQPPHPVDRIQAVMAKTLFAAQEKELQEAFAQACDDRLSSEQRKRARAKLIEAVKNKVPQAHLAFTLLKTLEFHSKGKIARVFHFLLYKLIPTEIEKIDRELYQTALRDNDYAYLAEATLLGRGIKADYHQACAHLKKLSSDHPTVIAWQLTGLIPKKEGVQPPTVEALITQLQGAQTTFATTQNANERLEAAKTVTDTLRLLALTPPSDVQLRGTGLSQKELFMHLALLAEDGDVVACQQLGDMLFQQSSAFLDVDQTKRGASKLWFEKAAKSGWLRAQRTFAIHLLRKDFLFPKEFGPTPQGQAAIEKANKKAYTLLQAAAKTDLDSALLLYAGNEEFPPLSQEPLKIQLEELQKLLKDPSITLEERQRALIALTEILPLDFSLSSELSSLLQEIAPPHPKAAILLKKTEAEVNQAAAAWENHCQEKMRGHFQQALQYAPSARNQIAIHLRAATCWDKKLSLAHAMTSQYFQKADEKKTLEFEALVNSSQTPPSHLEELQKQLAVLQYDLKPSMNALNTPLEEAEKAVRFKRELLHDPVPLPEGLKNQLSAAALSSLGHVSPEIDQQLEKLEEIFQELHRALSQSQLGDFPSLKRKLTTIKTQLQTTAAGLSDPPQKQIDQLLQKLAEEINVTTEDQRFQKLRQEMGTTLQTCKKALLSPAADGSSAFYLRSIGSLLTRQFPPQTENGILTPELQQEIQGVQLESSLHGYQEEPFDPTQLPANANPELKATVILRSPKSSQEEIKSAIATLGERHPEVAAYRLVHPGESEEAKKILLGAIKDNHRYRAFYMYVLGKAALQKHHGTEAKFWLKKAANKGVFPAYTDLLKGQKLSYFSLNSKERDQLLKQLTSDRILESSPTIRKLALYIQGDHLPPIATSKALGEQLDLFFTRDRASVLWTRYWLNHTDTNNRTLLLEEGKELTARQLLFYNVRKGYIKMASEAGHPIAWFLDPKNQEAAYEKAEAFRKKVQKEAFPSFEAMQERFYLLKEMYEAFWFGQDQPSLPAAPVA